MTAALVIALGLIVLACALLALHLASAGMVVWRYRVPLRGAPVTRPFVSLVRPVCGLDPHDRETLASSFALDWPDYEVLFCAAHAEDAAIPFLRDLIAAHPERRAQILIGDDRVSGNPKLNNVVKGWRASSGEIVAMVDANVLLPKDYLAQVMMRMLPDTGMVSSPPIGTGPGNFPGALEAAFLNGMQARWQLAADQCGIGFAQGKNLVWRRDVLERAGGPEALGRELAEDIASTKACRAQGLKVRLARQAFAQPIGRRRFRPVWDRQLRWSRVRRAGFPGLFFGEALIGPVPPVLFLLIAGGIWSGAVWALVLPFVALWYGAEIVMCRSAGWPASGRDWAAMVARDLLLQPLWLATFARKGFEWRGTAMDGAKA